MQQSSRAQPTGQMRMPSYGYGGHPEANSQQYHSSMEYQKMISQKMISHQQMQRLKYQNMMASQANSQYQRYPRSMEPQPEHISCQSEQRYPQYQSQREMPGQNIPWLSKSMLGQTLFNQGSKPTGAKRFSKGKSTLTNMRRSHILKKLKCYYTTIKDVLMQEVKEIEANFGKTNLEQDFNDISSRETRNEQNIQVHHSQPQVCLFRW